MTTLARRLATVERAVDRARMEATCRVLARELGISEAELWAEAGQVAQERARFPDRAAHLRHVAAVLDTTVAELEAEVQRIDELVTHELAGT